jgi:signal transduction histidine kinase
VLTTHAGVDTENGFPVPLESVIATDELYRRPTRAPGYEGESRLMATLVDVMANASGQAGADAVLQRLVEGAVELCQAHSAGVSVLETENGHEIVRWRAAAGAWSHYVGGFMSRDASPCGTVLDRNAPMLMTRPQRHYVITGLPAIVEVLLVPIHGEGRPVGTLWIIAHDETRKFDAEDHRIMTNLSRFAATAYHLLVEHGLRTELAAQRAVEAGLAADLAELRRAEAALRDMQRQLQAELADSKLLQATSAELIGQDVETLYDKIIDAVVTIMRSDFACMRMATDENEGVELKLLVSRGSSTRVAREFDCVRGDSHALYREVFRTGKRVVIRDTDEGDFLTGTADLATARRFGIRAFQTTPLYSRGGALVGAISTYWREPHDPAERDLRLLDILARQAADLIESKRAQESLREANRRKDEFLATLAHELRNPLAPVRYALQVLRLKSSGPADLTWATELIDRQMREMTRLVDDLLDVSRISRDKLELRKERVDLTTALRGAIETSRPVIAGAGHELVVTLPAEPVLVDADLTRLSQVFANLLNNAAKFSEPGGRIILTTERQGSAAIVRVRDQGIGIPKDMLVRIFDPFTQITEAPERTRGGLGIGLTLVKRLVEMHGGTVAASSAGKGLGSEFSVRLPLASSESTPSPTEPDLLVEAPRKLRVLIVDDNPDVVSSLGRLLGRLGYEVRTAGDGIVGLEIAEQFRPTVALLDVGMPKMSGYDLARSIRELPWGADVVLIAVTGWGQPEDRRRAREAGFDHHLVKPEAAGELVKLLASLAT